MSLRLNSDTVALLALIVSLVALLIGFLQVMQQYAATAYDYRTFSERTMGGWAKHTTRIFIPSEIRFEITYAVPHIDMPSELLRARHVGQHEIVDNPMDFPQAQRLQIQPTLFTEMSKFITSCRKLLRSNATKLPQKFQCILAPSTFAKLITIWLKTIHKGTIRIVQYARSWVDNYSESCNSQPRPRGPSQNSRPSKFLRFLPSRLTALSRCLMWCKPKTNSTVLSTIRTQDAESDIPGYDRESQDSQPRVDDWDDWVPIEAPKEGDEDWLPQLQEDWFLSLGGAVPEAACSWLRLLHDTQSTNLAYIITTKRLSFDYTPRGVTRPLATIDRWTFLSTLTLLGTEWKDRGNDGIFVGRSSLNGIDVTMANIPAVGTVYSYNRTLKALLPSAAKIEEDNIPDFSILSLFNCFHLMFFNTLVKTWSADEIRQSLTRTRRLDEPELADYFGQQYKLDGFNVGIGELIASWSTVLSMPRRSVNGLTESVFSSSSLGCTFGMPLLSAILLNKEGMMDQHRLDEEDAVLTNFVKMIEGYYSFLKADPDHSQSWLDKLFKCLEWAARVPTTTNILFYPPKPYDLPDLQECLNLMAEKNSGLDNGWDWSNTTGKMVGIAMLKAYYVAKKDLPLMQGPIGDKANSWIREAVLLTAMAASKALEELSELYQEDTNPDFWRNAIINRILRGVLWTIHNGNAPGTDPLAEETFGRYGIRKRGLECSLSSEWLHVETAMYIS